LPIGSPPVKKPFGAAAASPVREQELDGPHIAFMNERAFSQRAFAFARLRAQNMAAKRFVVDHFARSRFLESLGGGTVGFDFRHWWISLMNVPSGLFD
jgi:hypothetical protein